MRKDIETFHKDYIHVTKGKGNIVSTQTTQNWLIKYKTDIFLF